MNFHPDQLWSVQKNPTKFHFLLTFWPVAKVKAIESLIEWYCAIVSISVTHMKEFGLKVCVQCQMLKYLPNEWTDE